MKVLTVVIPSYNTEEYIDECLPTLSLGKIDDIEILLISDGSTDNTLQKIRIYESKYPNSIRVIDKQNGGHGSVINRGIKEARGKYFKVIDGDDWVKTDGFEKLISCLKNLNVDLILNPYIAHNIVTNTEKTRRQDNIRPGKVYSFDESTESLGLLALHGITYKTSLLKENGIYLQEKCFYEDAEYCIYPVPYIRNVIYLDFPVYVYRIGSSAQSINPQKAVRNRDMLNAIVNNLIDFYIKLPNNITMAKRKYIRKQICSIIQNMYGVYLKMPLGREAFDDIREFDKRLKGKSQELYAASGTGAIKALRLDNYLVYMIGCKMFEEKRRKRGF